MHQVGASSIRLTCCFVLNGSTSRGSPEPPARVLTPTSAPLGVLFTLQQPPFSTLPRRAPVLNSRLALLHSGQTLSARRIP